MSWLLYAMAIPPLLVVFLRVISAVLPGKMSQLVSFTAFTITGFLMLLLCASYGVVASLCLRVVGYGGLGQWTVARAFKWTMYLSTGVTFNVYEKKDSLKTRPVVFVGNHQTELDVLMLGCVFPKYTSVTAKKSLRWWPFLGWFMALSKTVFIDRANRTNARAAFDGAAKTMRSEGQNVFIFPEGTRSYAEKPELLPFKKGAFHLAVQAQVPIVPVVTAEYSEVLNVKKKRFSPGSIDVTVLPAIETKGMTAADVDDLVKRTRDSMLDELMRLSYVKESSNGVATGKADAQGELRKRN